MEHKPVLRIAGPAWELVRSFLLLAYLAASSSSAANADMLSAPWLTALGASGLVMPAAFLMFSLAPTRYAAYLPLLKLGKGLELAAVALLFATGTVTAGSGVPLLAFRVPVLGSTAVVFGLVAILDLAVLAGLFRVRTGNGTTAPP